MDFIIGLIVGAIAVSIAWFFAWNNNKAKFQAALDAMSAKIPK
jgi:hypothetical protein